MVLEEIKISSFSWYNYFMATKIKDFQNDKIYTLSEESRYGTLTPQFTGRYWIDGKKIYRIVLEIDGPVLNSTTDYTHYIPLIDTAYPVNVFVKRKADKAVRNINFSYSTSTCIVQINETKFSYRIPVDLWGWTATSSLYILYAVIEFTMTTEIY